MAGTQKEETSRGQRQSLSNFSSMLSYDTVARRGTSSYSATTRASSTPGKTDEVGPGKSTPFSDVFTYSSRLEKVTSTLSTYEAKTTPPIVHPGGVSFLDIVSFQNSKSHKTSVSGLANTISLPYQTSHSPPVDRRGDVSQNRDDLPRAFFANSIKPRAGDEKVPSGAHSARIQGSGAPKFDTPLPSPALETNRPKPYPVNMTPTPSALRPHCHAHERLKLWRPISATHSLPDVTNVNSIHRLQSLMACAWSENTRSVYGSGLLAFHVWCDQKGISELLRAPASGLLINNFIASLAGGFAKDTIVNYVSGVRAWHILHYIPWEMDTLQYQAALKASESVTPPSSRKPRRRPCTVADLKKIHAALDLSTPKHAAVWACVTSLFYGIARMGELTVENKDGFIAGEKVDISCVTNKQDRHGFEVTVIHIPFTKVTRARGSLDGEEIFWAKQSDVTDPHAALENHIRVNNPQPGEHLFAHTHGSRKPLSRHCLMLEINKQLAEAGHQPLKGHSFRIGGTLEFLLRGVSFEVVKSKGRWASDAFQVYLREHAQVMAPYVQDAPTLRDSFIEWQLSATSQTAKKGKKSKR